MTMNRRREAGADADVGVRSGGAPGGGARGKEEAVRGMICDPTVPSRVRPRSQRAICTPTDDKLTGAT